MSLQKLTAADLAKLAKTQKPGRTRAEHPYAGFFSSIRVGQGGSATVAEEGISRQGLKLRITAAATAAGITIQFLRSGPDEVKFKVVGRSSSPPSSK